MWKHLKLVKSFPSYISAILKNFSSTLPINIDSLRGHIGPHFFGIKSYFVPQRTFHNYDVIVLAILNPTPITKSRKTGKSGKCLLVYSLSTVIFCNKCRTPSLSNHLPSPYHFFTHWEQQLRLLSTEVLDLKTAMNSMDVTWDPVFYH